jgi:hypothetical protein
MNAKNKAEHANAEGKCIICGESQEGRRRGLCQKHYEQYRRKRNSLRPELVSSWEATLIDAGKLLPNRQGKQADAEQDAFADEFEAFLADNPNALAKTTITPAEADAKLVKQKEKTKRKP